MKDYQDICIVIKNNKVDNLIITESTQKAIEHAENMIEQYKGEYISQIVVFRSYTNGTNEIMYEYIPYKRYELLVNDEWCLAELTEQQYKNVTEKLNDSVTTHWLERFDLLNGEIISMGDIDNIREV
jgi:hypothetical protein